MSDSIADTGLNDVSPEETTSDPQPNEVETGNNGQSKLFEILKADAPEDNGQYTDHPLNFDGQESTAKIIRSIEGFTTDLNKAVVLLVVGVVEKYTEMQDQGSQEDQEDPDLGNELEPQGEEL
jgi:hypothetical protein